MSTEALERGLVISRVARHRIFRGSDDDGENEMVSVPHR